MPRAGLSAPTQVTRWNVEISIAVRGWGKTADPVTLGETWERELGSGYVLRYGRSAAYAGIGDPGWRRSPPRLGGVVYRRVAESSTATALPTGTQCMVVTGDDRDEFFARAAQALDEGLGLESETCTVERLT